MARYEKDYGRDYGRWQQQGRPTGGMRSDGWGGSGDWRQFAGEEGWYGAGYEGMPGFGYDAGIRGEDRSGRWGGWGSFGSGPYGGRFAGGQSSPRGGEHQGYGGEFRSQQGGYGGRNWETGHPNRGSGYTEGWENAWGGGRNRPGRSGHSAERGPTRAAELMTENPQTVTPEATVSEVAQKMRDLDVGIIPVVDNEQNRRLRGVITDRDIAIRAVAEGKGGNVKVSDCMTQQVRTVNKNDSVQDVMRVMRQEQVRRVPVTDREGRLVGIIAQADLAVDYGGDDWAREREVEETLERVSWPAEPKGRGERGSMSAGGATGMGTETTSDRGRKTARPQASKGREPAEG